MRMALVTEDTMVSSADPTSKSFQPGPGHRLVNSICLPHDKFYERQSPGCRGRERGTKARAANPASRESGLRGVVYTSKGFPEPEPANLHPRYKKLIVAESVLNYLKVDDST